MNFRLLLLLPLCGVPAWFGGRWLSGRGEAEAGARHSQVPAEARLNTAGLEAKAETWEALCQLAPTAAHRWRALELFERWAADDPRAAAARLAEMPVAGCALWPGRGALEAFFKVWAARDPEAAWAAVQEERFKAARAAVAALRAESHPEEIALDESLDKEVRHLARLKLAARDPAAAVKLGWLRNDTLVAALMGARDPVACWREICAAGGVTYDLRPAIERMTVHSRGAAVELVKEILGKQGGDEDYSARAARDILVRTATNPAELKAVPPSAGGYSYTWANAMQTWNEGTLREVLERTPGSAEEEKDDRLIFSGAVSELLARDPMALLPYLQRWGTAEQTAAGLSTPHTDHTPERAGQLRKLIEAAPGPWGLRLAEANAEMLGQFEPGFLLARIEAHMVNAAEQGTPIAAEGVLGRWLEQDPAAAMSWMQAHPAAVTRQEVEKMAREWTGHDPESASAWINSLTAGAQKDAAIRGLVEKMTAHDPASAGAWAARLSDPAERARVQEQVLQQWRVWEPGAQLPP